MALLSSKVPTASSSSGGQDQHHPSQELVGSENSLREHHTGEQALQKAVDMDSDYMKVQEPVTPQIISRGQLQVTILPRADAHFSAQTAGRLQPHLPPYEWSFWIDACLRGPKPAKLNGCGFCVVNRRLDNSDPGDRDSGITWWQSCFVARNFHQIGHAEMLAVAQALEMAVDQCERISGIAVTKARIKRPAAAEELRRRAATIPWPMPKVVNVFTDSQQILDSLNCCWLSGRIPGRRSPMRHANTMIEALSDLGVKVHLQWVPGLAGDHHNRWAHEGARNALKPQLQVRKVYTKKLHCVHRRRHKDRFVTRPFIAAGEMGLEPAAQSSANREDW